MAKEVIWSLQAHRDRREILEFWIKHNKSNAYSIKLNRLFKAAIKIISEHPGIGKPTDLNGVRGKIVRDYIIFYRVKASELLVLTIWGARQDPSERNRKIEEGYS